MPAKSGSLRSSLTALSASARVNPETTMVCGLKGASSRATAMPTSPDPPSNMTVQLSMFIQSWLLVQLSDFPSGKFTPGSWSKIVQGYRAVPCAHQPYDVVSERSEDASHFPLAPLCQRHAQGCGGCAV